MAWPCPDALGGFGGDGWCERGAKGACIRGCPAAAGKRGQPNSGFWPEVAATMASVVVERHRLTARNGSTDSFQTTSLTFVDDYLSLRLNHPVRRPPWLDAGRIDRRDRGGSDEEQAPGGSRRGRGAWIRGAGTGRCHPVFTQRRWRQRVGISHHYARYNPWRSRRRLHHHCHQRYVLGFVVYNYWRSDQQCDHHGVGGA